MTVPQSSQKPNANLKPAKLLVDDEVLVARQKRRDAFLQKHNLGDAAIEALPADASFRRYYRITPKGTDRSILLMEDPPDRPPVPPYVMVEPFKNIDEHLRSLGLHAPEIYACDIEQGLMLLEDFGDNTYTRMFNDGGDVKALYEAAVDVLIHLHNHPLRNEVNVPVYDAKMLANESLLFIDWYLPHLLGVTVTEDMRQSFAKVMSDLCAGASPAQTTFVLRDYHVDNLMVVKGQTGLNAVGLLDFQDGVKGQFAYDVMSLLEDARREVPDDLKNHLYQRYLSGMGPDFDRDAFDTSFKILAAQRHAKVLGIFVRLCVRDGKERYLQWIPHVQKLFVAAVDDPALRPLKQWLDDHKLDIRAPLNKDALKKNLGNFKP
jgi:hypothetical protein